MRVNSNFILLKKIRIGFDVFHSCIINISPENRDNKEEDKNKQFIQTRDNVFDDMGKSSSAKISIDITKKLFLADLNIGNCIMNFENLHINPQTELPMFFKVIFADTSEALKKFLHYTHALPSVIYYNGYDPSVIVTLYDEAVTENPQFTLRSKNIELCIFIVMKEFPEESTRELSLTNLPNFGLTMTSNMNQLKAEFNGLKAEIGGLKAEIGRLKAGLTDSINELKKMFLDHFKISEEKQNRK